MNNLATSDAMGRSLARILLVAGDSGLEQRVRRLFPGADVNTTSVTDLSDSLSRQQQQRNDVVILSSAVCKQQGVDARTLLEPLGISSPSVECIYLTDTDGIEEARTALGAGAFHYAKLPVSDEELRLLVETALDRSSYPRVHRGQQNTKRDRLGRIIGQSLPIQHVYRQLERAAETDVLVLLLGETGTGKDMAAQAIHNLSRRREGPFIAVNLGALPKELVASELFGHEKGAFTGAIKGHRGKLEQAENGSVFLDEIDAIDEKMQISLLRVIEQKSFHRLGGEQRVKTNARMIVASNQNLERLVQEGKFREDLFYRIDVFRIAMPPLTHRRGDLHLLAGEFLTQFSKAFKKDIRGFSSDAMKRLEVYDWPGNIRELKNVVQRAVLVCDEKEILPKHLPAKFQGVITSRSLMTFEVGTPLEQIEREMILRTLSVCNNNRTDAARLLGISRRSMYTRLKKYNID